MKNQITFKQGQAVNFDSTIKLTKEQALKFGIDPSKDQQRGELKTFGCWGIPYSFRALCVSAVYEKTGYSTECTEKTVYGMRTMSNVKQGGYELEGRVSVNGKKYTCFTSSQSFEIDGKSIEIATIHARIK